MNVCANRRSLREKSPADRSDLRRSGHSGLPKKSQYLMITLQPVFPLTTKRQMTPGCEVW